MTRTSDFDRWVTQGPPDPLDEAEALAKKNYARGVVAYLGGLDSPSADACEGWSDAKRHAETMPRHDFMVWASGKIKNP